MSLLHAHYTPQPDNSDEERLEPITIAGDKASISPRFKSPGRVLHEAPFVQPYVIVHCGYHDAPRTSLQCQTCCADSSWSSSLRNAVRRECDIWSDVIQAHQEAVDAHEDVREVMFDVREMMP